MAAKISVGIIGLGRIGASIGLALKRYNARKDARQQFAITGYAANNLEAQGIKTLDAVDQVARNFLDAATDKDIVVLALPYRDVQSAYQLIGKELRPGSVLLDTSPLKLPSQEWATKYLADEAHIVGVTPILNPKYLFDGMDNTEHAAVDLFDGGTLLLVPSPRTEREAVELAADFGYLLGMTPLFADTVEHDAWASGVEALPAALGVAAFYALNRSDGWNDARRVGNPSFGRMTHHLFDQHPDDVRDLMLNNREALVRQIDATVETLQALRGLLADNDRAALEEMLIETMDTYVTWVVHRREGRWDKSENPLKETSGSIFMSGVFGGFLSKKIRREKDDDE